MPPLGRLHGPIQSEARALQGTFLSSIQESKASLKLESHPGRMFRIERAVKSDPIMDRACEVPQRHPLPSPVSGLNAKGQKSHQPFLDPELALTSVTFPWKTDALSARRLSWAGRVIRMQGPFPVCSKYSPPQTKVLSKGDGMELNTEMAWSPEAA